MKRKFLSLAIAFMMVLTLLPAIANAEGIDSWAKLQAALNAGGTIKLASNITATTDDPQLIIPDGVSVTLDLAGKTIDRKRINAEEDGSVLLVLGELTLCDTVGGGKITGGYIDYQGGGIYVTGVLIMEGGEISGNTAEYDGGGIYVDYSGSLIMNGGIIKENTAHVNGGGLYIQGNFIMNDGEISGNFGKHSSMYGDIYGGGGVTVAGGTFTMKDGIIRNNTGGYQGGGVNAESGTFIMEGGMICNNTADYGGGVYVNPYDSSEFIISGDPVIIDNRAGAEITDGVLSGGILQNVYIGDDRIITIGGPVGAEAQIGVTVKTPPAEGESLVFTQGLKSGDQISAFTSDDPDYAIGISADGKEAAVYNTKELIDPDKVIASGTCGENLTWKFTEGGTLTISGYGEMTNWESFDQVPWYAYRDRITKIIIEGGAAQAEPANLQARPMTRGAGPMGEADPDGVTSIGSYAFYGCKNLAEIVIPGTVTVIGEHAFADCESLAGVAIPEGVTSIGDGAFEDCAGLESVSIPESVTSIGSGAFSGCKNLSEVEYAGSKTQWSKITIEDGNDIITEDAEINYAGVDPYTSGDVDKNGQVNTTDVILVRRYIAGGYDVQINENAADVDGNGQINTTDVILMRRAIAGGYGVVLQPGNIA